MLSRVFNVDLIHTFSVLVFEYIAFLQNAPLALLAAIVSVYFLSKIIYRLHFHPLRNFPGPLLARGTSLYEFYYDILRDGKTSEHLYHDLHPKYGPIVRFHPNRLRVASSEAFFQMYSHSSPFEKDNHQASLFGFESILSIRNNDEHNRRRAFFNDAYTKENILKAEGMTKSMVEKLVQRIAVMGTGGFKKPIDFFCAVTSLSLDVYGQFTFGFQFNTLDTAEFQHPQVQLMRNGLMELVPWTRHFYKIYIKIKPRLPLWIRSKIFPVSASTVEFPQFSGGLVQGVIDDIYAKHVSAPIEVSGSPSTYTVIKQILAGKTQDRVPETFAIDMHLSFLASIGTTAATILCALHYISAKRDIQERLFTELKTAIPNLDTGELKYSKIESLPFLTAVIKESLRLGMPVLGGLSRISPKEGITLCGRYIPGGITIDASVYSMHMNPEVFNNPVEFLPERWLVKDTAELDKHLVAFGRGARSCLGMHMAYLVIYLAIAAITRRFELQLTDKSRAEGYRLIDAWVAGHRGGTEFSVETRGR